MALLILSTSGCKHDPLPLLDGHCHMEADQAGSLRAIPSKSGVKVVADSRFSKGQWQDIQNAVAQWNLLGQYLRNRVFLEVERGEIPELPSSATTASAARLGGNERFFIGRITSKALWESLGLGTGVPGVNLRLTAGGELTHQIVLINPNEADPSQFHSVVLHELGHALGLGHSCDPSGGSPDYAACDPLRARHPYHLAVMFPSLMRSGSFAETKDVLRSNDMIRTQCAYLEP